jgi:kumamolisin
MTDGEVQPKWTPQDFACHYGVPKGLDGSGQTIAVIDMGEALDLAELARDFRHLKLPMPEISVVLVDGATGSSNDPAATETHIDVEVLGAICPAAHLRVYLCANTFSALPHAIARAVQDGADVLSISWGLSEDDMGSLDIAQIETALEAASQAGVSVCAAAGDGGASCYTDATSGQLAPRPKGGVSCVYPASSIHVLACGGTELIKGPAGLREVVWNNAANGGRATGGGVSKQFQPPEWQAGFDIPSANKGASAGRILPDVAAAAALGDWRFFKQGGAREELRGGTSAVTPFFAGLIALANQKRAATGKSRLGPVAPALYAAAAKGGLFNDITEGDNRIPAAGEGYSAGPGFDACTGWGSPRAAALIDALAAIP